MFSKNRKCKTCRYRSDQNNTHGCDYAFFTGRTRTSQVKKPEELQPEHCPFYIRGPRYVADTDLTSGNRRGANG